MKGLLKKELYLLFGMGQFFLIFTLAFAIAGAFSTEMGNFYSVFALVYIPLGAFSIFSYEEKWRWSAVIQCAPVTRFQIVLAKYIITLLHILIVAVVYEIAGCVSGSSVAPANLYNGMTVSFLVTAVSFPLIFYFGSDKARGIIVGICAAAGALLAVFVGMPDGTEAVLTVMQIRAWMPAAAFLLFCLSCPLTAWCYKKQRK